MSETPRLRDSCDACAQAKVKCSKKKPVCARCRDKKLICHFAPSARYGRLPASARAVKGISARYTSTVLRPPRPWESRQPSPHNVDTTGRDESRGQQQPSSPQSPASTTSGAAQALSFSLLPPPPPPPPTTTTTHACVMPVPSYALALNSHSTDNAALAGDVAFLTPMDGDMEFTWDMDMSANAFHSAQGTDSPISGDDSSPWYPDFTFADASLTAATDSAWPNDIYPSPRISNHATVATTTTSLGIELLNRGHCIKDSSINQSDDVPICPLASAAIISSSSRTTSGHSCLTEAIEILKSMKGERAAHTAAAAAAAAPFKTMVSANHRALARATAILEARECQCAAVDYHVMVIAILIAAEAAEQFSAAVRRGCGGSGPPSDGGDAGVRDLARLVRGEIHQLMHIIEARTICEDRLVRAGPAATAAASPSPGGLSSEYARAVLSSVLTQLEADLRAKLRSLAKDTTRILQQLWEPSE